MSKSAAEFLDWERRFMADEHDALRAIAEAQPSFSRFLGIELLSYTRDRVDAELVVREEMANRNGMLHGGVIMAFADNLGGTAASLNLLEGTTAVTMESKTNFVRPVSIGDRLNAACVPLHRGRTTSIWQTTVHDGRGRLVAIVSQTQMILMGDT